MSRKKSSKKGSSRTGVIAGVLASFPDVDDERGVDATESAEPVPDAPMLFGESRCGHCSTLNTQLDLVDVNTFRCWSCKGVSRVTV